MLRRMLRDKSGEGYILTAIRFVLVAAALLLVVCMMSIGIRAVYMDAAADQIRDSIAASSSTTDRNTRDTIEKWQDKIYFYAEFDADEWVDSSVGKLAYGTTFSVTLSYEDSLLFGIIPIKMTKYGVARHNWGDSSG